eukprot:TRINITY_DN2757_c0_g1_i1.p1 TRINITY_DN2757_c0_g1~~TRINITY_DN2757_c0_g1_i1.p1  ORF type:complete len:105 (-),score=21.65 TRINITY_DN2757_c0_g1_i1:58-372(-)
MEDFMEHRNVIVDHHSCDFFPERWFDLVIVLRSNNEILYPRLESRTYTQEKIQENISCEIFQVVLDSARESYKEEIVVELQSNNIEDMENNIGRIATWIDNFKE